MRKTKIICTLGPATDDRETLKQVILGGMNVARFNFSHGDHAQHLNRLNLLRELCDELHAPVAALLDTKGPEVRLKNFEGGAALLEEGQLFTLTSEEVAGTAEKCTVTYKGLAADVTVGTTILLDDGLIELKVEAIDKNDVICRILNGGRISDHKGVNVPGVSLNMPYISKQDREDILFGIEQDFDFIAASFVSSAKDILQVRSILDANKGGHIKIIAKIENGAGINNIDEIIAASDGIMVARGDMGVEINFADIPIIQKNIIWHCYNMGKPAITATQMLDSMTQNPRPTRAEITDVANAIYDGTSAIMLSGETAAGKHPVEAVCTMANIAEHTEMDINYNKRLRLREIENHLGVADAMAHAACTTAMDIKASAIITTTRSGETARLLCKYRPAQPIIACVTTHHVARQLALSWGITPLLMPMVKTTDEMIDVSVETARKAGYVKDGDMVVLTAGVPVGIPGTTNMLKAHLVGDALISGVGVGAQIVSGKLCVCHTAEEVHANLKDGDVLVIAATNNDMLADLRRASAIVTEAPGTNSHAAVVGLTLGKPVIVGATGATVRLKNHTLVSVDPKHGIVQVMPS
ncbi:MAG: pyruvate kinase [Oscillospiraceae bacterium]|nr:pyruvate kinase [Oscillospiraceae bacterium]